MSKRLLRGGSEAGRAGAALEAREPWVTTDGGRNGVGTTVNTNTELLADVSITATGTTTLALIPNAGRTIGRITVAAGASAYTRKVVLPETITGLDTNPVAPMDGDTIWLRVEIALDGEPTVEFHTGDTAGTAIRVLKGDTFNARNYGLHFVFKAGEWVLQDERQITDRDPLTIERDGGAISDNVSVGDFKTITFQSGSALNFESGAQINTDGEIVWSGGLKIDFATIGATGSSMTLLKHGQVTLVNGVATVSVNPISADAEIWFSRASVSGTAGIDFTYSVVPNTNFQVSARDASGTIETADQGVLNWLLIEA